MNHDIGQSVGNEGGWEAKDTCKAIVCLNLVIIGISTIMLLEVKVILAVMKQLKQLQRKPRKNSLRL